MCEYKDGVDFANPISDFEIKMDYNGHYNYGNVLSNKGLNVSFHNNQKPIEFV